MAACPQRVEEKGPYKIRTKSLTTNVIGNCTDDEIKSSQPDDVEDPPNISRVEAKEDGVVAGNELLRTLSFGEFEDLLQEISTTPFTNKNCVDNNLVKKLIDNKVIDEKCLENDASVSNWSFKPWSARFGSKEGRRGFDRKSRLESCGASSSLDSGGGNNNGSAASRTTQGGSLQNLHGKSELGKKSSLHKSGSLNTFPNASSYENCEKLAAVKSMLVNSVATASKISGSTNQSKRIRNNGGGSVVNYGTSTCCSAVTTSVSSSSNNSNNNNNNNISVSNNAIVNSRTQCGGDLKDMNLNSERTSVNPAAITLNIIEHQQLNASNGIFSDGYTGCNAFANKIEPEIPAEEKEMVMMMEVDVSNDGGESENIPLLKSNSSLIPNGNGIDLMVQERAATMTEVDTKVTLPLTLCQTKHHVKHEVATANTFPLFADDCRPTTIHHHLHSIPVINGGRQSDEKNKDDFDDNGNPLNFLLQTPIEYPSSEHYGSFSKTVSGNDSLVRSTDNRTADGRTPDSRATDIHTDGRFTDNRTTDCRTIDGRVTETRPSDNSGRGKKKSKVSNKQKVINPADIEGYFGALEVEVILERINSSDGHDANKLRNSVVDGKNKKSANKTKKIASNKEYRKNTENEMLRMNGNKEDIKSTGFEASLTNDSNLKDGNRLNKKKSSSVIPDESTSSGSHSPELDADDKDTTGSIPKSTHPISFSDVALPNADDFTSDKTVQGYAQVTDNLGSSFVSDFYWAAESQPVVEESEFHEVKKKKKKKPRSMYSSRSDGGSSSSTYNRHQRHGGMEEAESGRNSSSAASWASLSSHRRGLYMSDDLRRKSTSSMPSSDHSSPDNSDVESVHSLPAGSTTLRSTISKTSSSSSCTPQASYADIAKMTAAAIDSSNSYKFCPLSPPAPLNSELEIEKRKETFIQSAASHVPLESEEVGHSESLLEVEQMTKDVKTANESPEEPSIESSMYSSLDREVLCDSPNANPGVEFVGGLELPEDTIEVSFGFEVNEQLLRMTEAELMAMPEINRDHMLDAELQMQQAQLEPMVIGANVIYGFPKSDHVLNLRPEHQGLINSHISSNLPLITALSALPHPTSSFQSPQQLECGSSIAFSVPVLVSAEPIYTSSPSTEHQNIVDYVGLTWLKVSEEIERESNDQLPKRVRYFNKN